ncbi:unnamed protein product [Ectocarpus fasciculatus]
MCSEGASAGSWAQLGFPLRRRACWHLLRCVWSTTYCFRRLEDEVDAAGAPARTSPEDMAQLRSSLAIGADRFGWKNQLRTIGYWSSSAGNHWICFDFLH